MYTFFILLPIKLILFVFNVTNQAMIYFKENL